MSLWEFSLSTAREGLYNVTDKVAGAVRESGVAEGICVIYCPHTTAGITINENADPDVKPDILRGMATAFPDDPSFRHMEGNSTGHLKASCMGASATVIVTEGRPLLGTWQGIYFCEFDGPRKRRFYVKVVQG
jgi:secondary thiamine-phosphate synthase enzyme